MWLCGSMGWGSRGGGGPGVMRVQEVVGLWLCGSWGGGQGSGSPGSDGGPGWF